MSPRSWLFAIVLTGVAVHAPGLWMGFYVDDHVHQLALDGELPLSPLGLYDFGERADWLAAEELGSGFPWWTAAGWKARFLRPIASATLWLDHALYGRWALGYHLTSLLWFALVLLLAHALYRALGLGVLASRLAVALLAVSGSTALPVGWIANRNSLVALAFLLLGVLCVARRAVPRSGDVLAGYACALCAALSKESGIVGFLLVALAALWPGPSERAAERSAARRRIAVLGVLLAVGYVAVFVALGYGTRSAFYATPWDQPVRYLGHLALLTASAALSFVTPLSADMVLVAPIMATVLLVGGVVVGAPLWAWIGTRVCRTQAAAFLGLWMVLTLLPEGGAPPSDRLLLASSVGACGWLGLLGDQLARGEVRGRLARYGATAVLLGAGPVSALALLFQGVAVTGMSNDLRSTILSADVGPPSLGRRDVLVLQGQSVLIPFAMASTWGVESADRQVRFWPIQCGRRGLEWTRTDDRTLRLRSLDAPFLDSPFEIVYLTDRTPPRVDDVWRTGLFEARAVEVDDAGLRTVELTFERSLDDPALRFLVPEEGRLVAITPPRPGQTRRIETFVPANPMLP